MSGLFFFASMTVCYKTLGVVKTANVDMHKLLYIPSHKRLYFITGMENICIHPDSSTTMDTEV